MSISKKQYNKMVEKASPPSPKLKNFFFAYLIGGLICMLGQLLTELYGSLNLEPQTARMLVPITLIVIAALLTGFKIFDNIAKVAGAGTLVPITGFSNAITSPAIEFKSEGFVLGVGAKMFSIAGPVILYGVVASVVYGIIYWVTTLF
ncbi:MAG: stage V sporulation protein AC [Acutalibacteraceae bacterium]|nr:stage V sporulation protein AC [Acutalibacteraceae bacterium]